MKRIKFAFGVLMLFASGGAAAQSLSQMTAAAKALLSDRMLDPSSLQYRKLRVVAGKAEGSSGPMLCGQYNAKNRLGGYVGYKDFVYDPHARLMVTIGGSFYSDTEGDFSLDDLSKAKITPETDFNARLAELRKWGDRYETYLMNCA